MNFFIRHYVFLIIVFSANLCLGMQENQLSNFESSDDIVKHIAEDTNNTEEIQKICSILFLRELMINSFMGDQYFQDAKKTEISRKRLDNGWYKAFEKHKELHDNLFNSLCDQSKIILIKLEELLAHEGSGFTFNFFNLLVDGFKALSNFNINNIESCFKLNKCVLELFYKITQPEYYDEEEYFKMKALFKKSLPSLIDEMKQSQKAIEYYKNITPFSTTNNMKELNQMAAKNKKRADTFIASLSNYKPAADFDPSIFPSTSEDIQNYIRTFDKENQNLEKNYIQFSSAIEQIEAQLSNKSTLSLCENAIHFKQVYAKLYHTLYSKLDSSSCDFLKGIRYFESSLPNSIFLLDRIVYEETNLERVKQILNIFQYYQDIQKEDKTGKVLAINCQDLKSNHLRLKTLKQFETFALLKKEDPFLYSIVGQLSVFSNSRCHEIVNYVSIESKYILDERNLLKFNDIVTLEVPSAIMKNWINDLIEKLDKRKIFLENELLLKKKLIKNKSKQKGSKKQSNKTKVEPKKVLPKETDLELIEAENPSISKIQGKQEFEELDSNSINIIDLQNNKAQKRKHVKDVEEARNILLSIFAFNDLKHQDKQHAIFKQLLCNRTMQVILYLAEKEIDIDTENLNISSATLKQDMYHVISPLLNRFLKYGYILTSENLDSSGIHNEFKHSVRLESEQWALILEARIIMDPSYNEHNAISDRNKDLTGCHRGAYVFIFNRNNKCLHAMFHETRESKKVNIVN